MSESNSEFVINHGDEKVFGPENDRPKTFNFVKEIESLINPLDGKEKVINHDDLRRLALSATKPWNQSAERLDDLLKAGGDWYLDPEKKIPDEEWEILAGLIYKEKSQLQRQKTEKNSTTGSSQEASINLDPLINKISGGQEDLLKALNLQQITLEQFLNLSQKQTQNLSESFKRVPTKEERDRWLDVEYRQEFYTRFTPSLEPRFYTELNDEKERRLFDARWQLARAAYYKKATSGSPEKMIDNQDLILLKTEQMEQLYSMPGVKRGLEWYTDLIVNKKIINMKDGRKIDIFQCKNESDFEDFRENMRKEALSGKLDVKDKKGESQEIKLTDSEKKEADAVAWNWMWISNLMESADSRYSFGGERHNMAGDLVSDDLRATFHPQEKFENKFSARQEWGVFGKWGNVQLTNIKKEVNFDNKKDEIKFIGAKDFSEFWKCEKTIEKTDKDGIFYKIYVPECYPTTTIGSFWEEQQDNEQTSLLDYLKNGREIPWEELGTGLWVGYLPIKINKAVKLLDDYFKGKARLEEGKENEWVDPLKDVFVRLKLDKDKNNFHNLKVWSVYAGLGGVVDPDLRLPKISLSFFNRAVTEERLRFPGIKFLEKGEKLQFTY